MLALHARRALDNPMVLTKIWLIVAGIYIWEFITSLGYEWDVIRGHRSYRWTIWVYSITRIAALMSVILNLITFNTSTAINCQAWVTLLWTSSCLSLCTGSLLIVLRVIAIWDRSKIVMAISIGLWVTNASVIILSVARIRAIWLPLVNTCGVTNLDASKPTLIALFGTDFLLLLIMLAGLLRLRRRGGGTLKLGRILWRQGIIWLSISTIAELLQMLFLVLNINGKFRSLITQCGMLIGLNSASRTRQLVLVTRCGYTGNLFDPVISFSSKFFFPSRLRTRLGMPPEWPLYLK
ncbi:hypothetical protein DFH94DRAFT_77741 [Russula ochroleuca]|jgi:hypothetical protein|uniref:Uncharacterized protein n=1 Tax=Russula ochroleuca TaxID=152965 RepID=A0A9P5MTC1_9AGAM|nr:hypothetical protein DFH94DRAFT_77741 [Russula ochroleuca]